MTRRVMGLVVATGLILAIFGLAAGTRAQDDGDDFDDLQATAEAHSEAIEAQQTEIADLEATAEAQQAEIDALEERVVAVETAVAVEEVPQATPVTEEPVKGTGDVLYEADETGGFDAWTGSADWLHRDGQLVNDGSAIGQILAPYQPTTSDYAVEAEIRLVRCANAGSGDLSGDDYRTPGYAGGFGIEARIGDLGSYWAGRICPSPDSFDSSHEGIWAADYESGVWETLASQEYSDDAEWHTYRMEVQGDVLRLFIDGELVVETGDVRYVDSGQVGLWSGQTQISVRSFRVLAL
jgi:hypothetical protein